MMMRRTRVEDNLETVKHGFVAVVVHGKMNLGPRRNKEKNYSKYYLFIYLLQILTDSYYNLIN